MTKPREKTHEEMQAEICCILLAKKEVISFFPCPPNEGQVWAAPINRTSPSKKPGLMFQLFWDIFKNA